MNTLLTLTLTAAVANAAGAGSSYLRRSTQESKTTRAHQEQRQLSTDFIQPSWRDEVHAVWVNGPTHVAQLGGNWPVVGAGSSSTDAKCDTSVEGYTGYTSSGAYCEPVDDFFDQNPHLVMYSGKIGLVLDAKTTDGNLFRQVGSTTLMSSSVNELTAKHVYDNLETTSLEVLADLDCGSEGSFTLKAEKFQANAVEFGLVRQGHAVTHVTVEKLAWLNDQGYKPTLSSNPVCSPIEAPAQDPILNSSPDCNWHNANDPTKGNQNQNCFCAANHNPGSPDQTHSCSNPEYPICVGHVPGKSWGTCFQDTTQRNPDNAVCSKDSDCTDSNYSACKYGRCYVDLDSMCTASNPMFDVTMWGDSLAFNVFWDPLPTCTGTVTIHADTFSQSSSYESGQATLILTSSDGSATLTDATATAGNVNDLVVTSNGHAIAKRSKFGDIVVEVPTSMSRCGYDMNCALKPLQLVDVSVTNTAGKVRPLRLSLSRGFETLDPSYSSAPSRPGSEITGLSVMVYDKATQMPIGLPLHISKNWHGGSFHKSVWPFHRYNWWTANVMAHIPAGATFDMTFAVAYDRYKGVPAFSHAQLSIVGYSNKWLWEEAALGSGGENFCMDPYGSHTRAVVTDVRPRHFDGSWKQNIGGADFLQFWDSAGVYQMKKELDARLLSNGPDLSNATYTSISTDGAIKSEVQISGSRTDDLVRIFMRVRHEALSATDFSRLAYYSMGSETYNYYPHHESFTFGSGANITGYIPKTCGPSGNSGTSRSADKLYNTAGTFRQDMEGSGPWWVAMGENNYVNPSNPDSTMVVGDRGLVIRSFESSFATAPSISILCEKIELGPPRGVTTLSQGDFVDMQLEFLVLPRQFDNDFATTFANQPTSTSLAYLNTLPTTALRVREQAIRDIKVSSLGPHTDRVESNYPVRVCAATGFTMESDSVSFTVTGMGLGFVPIVLCDMDSANVPAGHGLWKRETGEGQFTMLTDETDARQVNFFDRANGKYEFVFNVEILSSETEFWFGPNPHPTELPTSSPTNEPTYSPTIDGCGAYYSGLEQVGEVPYDNCVLSGNCVEYTVVGPCAHSSGHTAAWGKYSVTCPIASTVTWNTGSNWEDFKMIPCYSNSDPNPSNEMVTTDGIMHFAWGGQSIFFWPTIPVDEVSAILPAGTKFRLYKAPAGSYSAFDPNPSPTSAPTAAPTPNPTVAPTNAPTLAPVTSPPTSSPTPSPTDSPTPGPTTSPSAEPTASPTTPPTATPTSSPTPSPTRSPTPGPTSSPTESPTKPPTPTPTIAPTRSPTPDSCDAYFAGLEQAGETPYDNCNDSGTCVEYQISGKCHHSAGHTSAWGKYSVFCPIVPTLQWNSGNHWTDFKMIPCYDDSNNPNPSNAMVHSDGIMHFAWAGSSLWFWPTVPVEEVSDILKPGAKVRLYKAPSGTYTAYTP